MARKTGRKEGKRNIGLWVEESLLTQIDRAAAAAGVPRAVWMENLFRTAVGFPPLEELNKHTPLVYVPPLRKADAASKAPNSPK